MIRYLKLLHNPISFFHFPIKNEKFFSKTLQSEEAYLHGPQAVCVFPLVVLPSMSLPTSEINTTLMIGYWKTMVL